MNEQFVVVPGPEEQSDKGKMKTKIRRLYDIANIMVAIGLIEKTTQACTKKPAFRWAGVHNAHERTSEVASSPSPPELSPAAEHSGMTPLNRYLPITHQLKSSIPANWRCKGTHPAKAVTICHS